ncbi:hypothetical protein M407DRAFT_131061 [Tulasnella calospora MUT 4182]|uniref:Senescence domain-containing protein n=1 Tax=Tulasnella calospora MUT 4182 TaxID=1051891 RepID=A0A0C3QHU5_9AGAM|nr:hypothetical protein M407DRAFT_131061 [Tulasnella calospora MUT 4182]
MTTIVSIDGCSVAQVLDSGVMPLASGTLDLMQDPETYVLTVKLQELAFALKDTPVYTHSDNSQWYFFKSPGVSSEAHSYVRIEFPHDVLTPGSPVQELRDRFENALIGEKLLKTGVEAAGDEIGASLKGDASRMATFISSQIKSYTSSHPATTEPATFSPTTHEVAEGAATQSGVAAGYAASAANIFAKTFIGAGQKIVDVFNAATAERPTTPTKLKGDLSEAGYDVDDGEREPDFPKELKDEQMSYENSVKPVIKAVQNMAAGVGDGTSKVTSAIGTGAHDVIAHDLGPEAADLSTKAGDTLRNVKSVTKNTLVVRLEGT